MSGKNSHTNQGIAYDCADVIKHENRNCNRKENGLFQGALCILKDEIQINPLINL